MLSLSQSYRVGFFGRSQRDTMDYQIFYKLDHQIDGQKLLNNIQSIINKFQQNNKDSMPILCISIKTITHEDTSFIPKLEHKIID